MRSDGRVERKRGYRHTDSWHEWGQDNFYGRSATKRIVTKEPSLVCSSSTVVALGYAGSARRLELAATYNITIFDAPSARQWISCCAEAAPVAPYTSLVAGVTRTEPPWRGFSRHSQWTSGHVVFGISNFETT